MYERYNLVTNPFLEESPDFPMINRKEIMKDLKAMLNRFVEQKSPQILAILGDYGIGKTFVLLQLLQQIKKRGKEGFLEPKLQRVLPVYLKVLTPKPPTKYSHYLYSEIMKRLGIETIRKISNRVKKTVQSDRGRKKIRNIDADFIKAFLHIGTERENVAWAFLRGDSIYASQMKEIEVSTKITTDEKAEFMLIEFLKLVQTLGYKALITLIDEFEYIFTATGMKRSAQLIVAFKDLYDKINESIQLGQKVTKIIFIIACTPGSWEEGIPSLMEKVGLGGIRPFWERIHTTYPMKPFNLEETEELIVSRLQKRRIKEDGPSGLFPFKKDFIKKINEVSDGVPRRILRRTAFVLDMADQREISEIGAKEVEEILKEYRYI